MNILVTGGAGYLGSNLIKRLQEIHETKELDGLIIAADVKEPGWNYPNVKFEKIDVRSPEIARVIEDNQIDTVVHLASIVTPGKKSNREFEYSVDVLGTENVLKACVHGKVRKIIVTSSGAAYGYHPDNPQWIKEDWLIRGNEEFSYSYHKRLVEEILEKYRRDHPELKQVIFRIGTILGENTKNQITDLFDKRWLLGISGSDSPFVFIWDQDVVGCLLKAILEEKTGIYNVAGDGALTIDEIGKLLKKPVLRIPAGFLKGALFILKRLSLTQYGEEQVNFLRYRPVLDNTKLKSEFGYIPQKTSREVFQFFMEHRKKRKGH